MTRYGMVIDLDRCTGCQACVVACASENNVPTVGEEEAARGRAMQWLRVERVTSGVFPHARTHFMPVLCQHCGAAPCEPVCPVFATYHNPDGLNAMVYSRCVGTRFCANNCPYTVRTFNWFVPRWEAPLERQHNPDVSVRVGGVMEKCTFCVQRIHRARSEAKREDRELRDGEFTTACAQSCPTRAIVFGDLEDKESEVARLADSERAFSLLGELGTRPAITYLKPLDWQAPLAAAAGGELGDG